MILQIPILLSLSLSLLLVNDHFLKFSVRWSLTCRLMPCNLKLLHRHFHPYYFPRLLALLILRIEGEIEALWHRIRFYKTIIVIVLIALLGWLLRSSHLF